MKRKIIKLKVWLCIFVRLLIKPFNLNAKFDDFLFLSDEETIEYIKKKNIGIVRFGDGEFNFTVGYPAIRQSPERKLRKKLIKILSNYNSSKNYLLAVPLDLFLKNNFQERNSTPENWRAPKYAALPFLKKKTIYGSPFCFRLKDIVVKDKNNYINLIKELFKGKDIIYIGSEENFEGMFIPVKFIKIPLRDAFGIFDELKKEIKKEAEKYEDPLVLISAGVTATAMSAELNDEGILTYDIGSLLTWN